MQHVHPFLHLTQMVNIGNIMHINRKEFVLRKSAGLNRLVKMDIDIARLKRTIITKNTTMEALAYELGINRSTLYRRLRKGSAGITLKDAVTISHALKLSTQEQAGIFGGRNVTRM